MAGTGCHRTEDTIALTKFAAEAGAKNALVINPYYMAIGDEAIYDYYKTVAESSDIGIVIYNYPDATGIQLEPELIDRISRIRSEERRVGKERRSRRGSENREKKEQKKDGTGGR